MLVDHEEVLLRLKEHIVGKNSHGQRDLLGVLTRLEVECRVPEGLPEKALRLYGEELHEVLVPRKEPAANGHARTVRHGSQANLSRGPQGPEEESHAGYTEHAVT